MGNFPNSQVSLAIFEQIDFQSLLFDNLTVTTITVPPKVDYVIVQPQGGAVRMNIGIDPVPLTQGLIIPDLGQYTISYMPDAIDSRFIGDANSGTLFVQYFKKL